MTMSKKTSASTLNSDGTSNNPLNIRPDKWDGEVGKTNGGFAKFDTLENGCRAALKNLNAYYFKRSLKTIDGIIKRWSATDQKSYISFVSKRMGVASDQVIKFDQKTIVKLAYAMYLFEGGKYDSKELLAAFDAAYIKLGYEI